MRQRKQGLEHHRIVTTRHNATAVMLSTYARWYHWFIIILLHRKARLLQEVRCTVPRGSVTSSLSLHCTRSAAVKLHIEAMKHRLMAQLPRLFVATSRYLRSTAVPFWYRFAVDMWHDIMAGAWHRLIAASQWLCAATSLLVRTLRQNTVQQGLCDRTALH